MISLVTFATVNMLRSAGLCIKSAREQGVDDPRMWIEEQIKQTSAYRNNRRLFDNPRGGGGCFAWKPAIISETMEDLEDGELLIYSDAGVEFIEPVQTVIDLMDQDIWLFGNEHLHARWCKRDIIEAVWPWWKRGRPSLNQDGDREVHVFVGDESQARDINVRELAWESFGKQAQASVIFFRVNDYTRAFVKEWLDWCLFEGGRLIDDSLSRTPNHPEFVENRHDQAILTTMAYRDGIKLHEWFVKYEGYTPGRMTGYPRELERPFVFHHRRRNSEWEGIAA